MKAFIYKDELFVRAIPGKQLFRSTMIHEAVNRGDIFAIRCRDQLLTIISGKEQVTHCEIKVPTLPSPEQRSLLEEVRESLSPAFPEEGSIVKFRGLFWSVVNKRDRRLKRFAEGTAIFREVEWEEVKDVESV